MNTRWVPAILAMILIVLAGCASGKTAPSSRSDEMKEGYSAAKRGYWQEALMRFERADQLEPNNAEVLNNLGVALEAVGRYEDAGEIYDKAYSLDPSDQKLKRNFRLHKDFYETYIEKEKSEEPAEEDVRVEEDVKDE